MARRLFAIATLAACGSPDAAPPDAPSEPIVRVTLANRPADTDASSFLVAYQDGADGWQLAPAPVDDVYSFQVLSPTWSFAWTQAPKDPYSVYGDWLGHVHVYGFTFAERKELRLDLATGTYPVSMQLWVTNPPMNLLMMGFGANNDALPPSSQTATESRYNPYVSPGTYDLVLGALDPACSSSSCTRIRVTSALTAGTVSHSDPTLPIEVDFAGGAPVHTAPVTVAANEARARTVLHTANGTRFTLVDTLETGSGFMTAGLAASNPGDVYLQEISVPAVLTEKWVTDVEPQTYVAPAELAPPAASWAGASLTATWSLDANASGYEWRADQNESCGIWGNGHVRNCLTRWTATLSRDFVGEAPGFQPPDFSSFAGWNPRLTFAAQKELTGTLRRIESTGGAKDLPAAYPADAGTQRTFTSVDWTLSP